MQTYPTEWPNYFTTTILKWKPLLKDDKFKMIIIDSLRFLVKENRIRLSAFVIMSTHIHLVWQPCAGNTKSQIQLQFMKFTAQQMKFLLQKSDQEFLKEFYVNKSDREYQIWKRLPLSTELDTEFIFHQKVDYIHYNPVKAGLCKLPEEYRFSSARYYHDGFDEFGLFP